MIRVENLHKEFDGKDVLKRISIEYKAGECSLIIGASGSGKTVLLKNLVGADIWGLEGAFRAYTGAPDRAGHYWLRRTQKAPFE